MLPLFSYFNKHDSKGVNHYTLCARLPQYNTHKMLTPKPNGKCYFCKFRAFWSAKQCKANKAFLKYELYEVQFWKFQMIDKDPNCSINERLSGIVNLHFFNYKKWIITPCTSWNMSASLIYMWRGLLKSGIARPSNLIKLYMVSYKHYINSSLNGFRLKTQALSVRYSKS